jgi:hypothetical protein
MRAIRVFGTVVGMSALRWQWSRRRFGAHHGSFLTWIKLGPVSKRVQHDVFPDWLRLRLVTTIAWRRTSVNLSNGEESIGERVEIRWDIGHGPPMRTRGRQKALGQARQVHARNQ